MLVRQGALSFSQWMGGEDPPLDVMRQAVFAALGIRAE
jgi:shikimate 5-dehydrogenase